MLARTERAPSDPGRMDSEPRTMAVDVSQLGKYRLIAELGTGGMAKVILAATTGAGHIKKLAVIKKLRDEFAGNPDFLMMLLSEANVATRLSHPNVIHVYEVGEDNGEVFIAMEYIDGRSLKQVSHRVGTDGPLKLAHYVRMLCSVLDGLHYTHELKGYDGRPLRVVHRAVSPQNILVTYDGNVTVVDFGIAKALDSGTETRTGVLKGKVAYMAPEQARGFPVDARADVFAVGVILWELAAGRRLWQGFQNTIILGRLMQDGPPLPNPSQANPRVPAEIDGICEKALSWDPSARFSSALEFKRALEHWLATTEPQVDSTEVGAIVSSAFASERETSAKLIEAAMHSPETLETIAAELPVAST